MGTPSWPTWSIFDFFLILLLSGIKLPVLIRSSKLTCCKHLSPYPSQHNLKPAFCLNNLLVGSRGSTTKWELLADQLDPSSTSSWFFCFPGLNCQSWSDPPSLHVASIFHLTHHNIISKPAFCLNNLLVGSRGSTTKWELLADQLDPSSTSSWFFCFPGLNCQSWSDPPNLHVASIFHLTHHNIISNQPSAWIIFLLAVGAQPRSGNS